MTEVIKSDNADYFTHYHVLTTSGCVFAHEFDYAHYIEVGASYDSKGLPIELALLLINKWNRIIGWRKNRSKLPTSHMVYFLEIPCKDDRPGWGVMSS